MRMLILALSSFTVFIGCFFYLASVIFSEHYPYTYKSFNYYLLTPSEISKMTNLCIDKPSFIYSIGDGNKASYTAMNCTLDREIILNHIKELGFEINKHGRYVKNNTKIEFLYDDTNDKVTEVTLYEY